MARESGEWYDVLDDPTAAANELADKLSVRAASDVLGVLHAHSDSMERLMALYALEETLRPLQDSSPDEVVSAWESTVSPTPDYHPMAIHPGDMIQLPWVKRAVGSVVTTVGAVTMGVCTLQLVRMMGAGIDPDVTAPEYVQGVVVGTLMLAGGLAIRGES